MWVRKFVWTILSLHLCKKFTSGSFTTDNGGGEHVKRRLCGGGGDGGGAGVGRGFRGVSERKIEGIGSPVGGLNFSSWRPSRSDHVRPTSSALRASLSAFLTARWSSCYIRNSCRCVSWSCSSVSTQSSEQLLEIGSSVDRNLELFLNIILTVVITATCEWNEAA